MGRQSTSGAVASSYLFCSQVREITRLVLLHYMLHHPLYMHIGDLFLSPGAVVPALQGTPLSMTRATAFCSTRSEPASTTLMTTCGPMVRVPDLRAP